MTPPLWTCPECEAPARVHCWGQPCVWAICADCLIVYHTYELDRRISISNIWLDSEGVALEHPW